MNPKLKLSFSFLLICLSIDASANDVYVSTTGNNSNSGTLNAPWKTIQYAVDNANAGTTIYVRGGTYSEKVLFSGSADSGASGNQVILKNMNGEFLIIDGIALTASDREGLISIKGSSHIKIYGFELKNFIYSGTTNTPVGFYMDGTCDNITFSNNKIHDIKNNSTCVDPCGAGAHGIGVFGTTTAGITNITFDSNEVYNCILQASEAL